MSISPAATPPPRVLVADDDAASRRFLGDALQTLGACVQDCADGHEALQWARDQRFDLLLLDCRMPGAGACEVLAALQASGGASCGSPAIASSAELDAAAERTLLACGFRDVLRKPCNLDALRRVLALLPGNLPVLDDATALCASGNATTMLALRQLLRNELALLERDLGLPQRDDAQLADRLHRLRSSCGFCGTPALAAETTRLQRQLGAGAPAFEAALAPFRVALRATLQALDA